MKAKSVTFDNFPELRVDYSMLGNREIEITNEISYYESMVGLQKNVTLRVKFFFREYEFLKFKEQVSAHTQVVLSAHFTLVDGNLQSMQGVFLSFDDQELSITFG